MKSRSLIVLGIVALATGLACGGASSRSEPHRSAAQSAQSRRPVNPGGAAERSHVFVIVLENREYGEVIGNADAPYINGLARRSALARRYHAITHPSLPNYLAMIAGSTFGIISDCTRCAASGSSLPKQLSNAGVSWRAYMQGMPRRCFLGAYSGRYAKKHNPFYYFPGITSDPALCNRVLPGGRLDRDLRNDSLPSFGWITPDLCNDAHDCSISHSDRYLADLVPRLISHLGKHGFLAVTFDEGTTSAGVGGAARGGRVATILAGPDIRRRARLSKSYTHYSLLRTLEDAFGLPHLRAAAGARALGAAFKSAPSGAAAGPSEP